MNTRKSRNVDVKDILTFINWMCSMRQTDGFAHSTVTCITVASCLNPKIKVDLDKNFTDIKDIIKETTQGIRTKTSISLHYGIKRKFCSECTRNNGLQNCKIVALTTIQGALRISNIVNLEYEDISLLNSGSMSIRIKSSKTDQAGREQTFVVTPKYR